MPNTDKQDRLEAVKQRILDDGITPELKEQATQLVFGEGNPNANIVIIGEAPGKKEDELGKPFVGASGKFLNQMLEMIGLQREDIYITNIVKYRPPDNRDPKPDEKKAFLPYLQSQLEVIQPKIVVTLGRHSMNCFLPDLQISKVHGEPKRVKLSLKENKGDILEVIILPLFHPAAALYNPAQRQTLIDDFAVIPIIMNKIKSS
ncbi:uracil-DNA glycosylase [Polaromonas sp.]|nr:uracil-DNA glycosylase [Candidatus Saccharibacteria bacterium]